MKPRGKWEAEAKGRPGTTGLKPRGDWEAEAKGSPGGTPPQKNNKLVQHHVTVAFFSFQCKTKNNKQTTTKQQKTLQHSVSVAFPGFMATQTK